MALKDWACGVCSAQNRSSDAVCRVCDTPRRQAEAPAVSPEAAPTRKARRTSWLERRKQARAEKRVAAAKDAPRDVPAGEAVPARPSPLARAMLPSSILWYVVIVCTAVQWLLNRPLPNLLSGNPLLILQRFSPGSYLSGLWQGVTQLAERFSHLTSLPEISMVWNYGMTTLSTALRNPLTGQCAALAAAWLIRLIVRGLAETREHAPLRRNWAALTILAVDLLLTLLALVTRSAYTATYAPMMLRPLFTLQLLASLAALAVFLLTGAFSRRRMTPCLLKSGLSTVLLWLLATLFLAI